MAQLALGVIGAAVGGYFGGPTGASIGWSIGSAAGGVLFADRTEAAGPRLQDLQTTASSYGIALPAVWGTARIAGNIIWAAPLREQESTERVGKGGGGSYYTTYTYFGSFAVALCEGEIAAISRIWANGKLVYDNRDTAEASMVAASADFEARMTVYVGDETQLASSVIEAIEGAGNVPAYRGVAYVVFDDLPLADYGNVLPNLEFEVIVDGATEVPVLVRQYANVDADVIPATSARLTGTTILLGHTSDTVTGRTSQLRTVIDSDADTEVVAAFTLPATPPIDYGITNYQTNQVRNDPYIRAFNIQMLDDQGDAIDNTQAIYFYYHDAYAYDITACQSRIWTGTPGPFASLSWDGWKYVYQSPIPDFPDILNYDILLTRLRLPRDQIDAQDPERINVYLPDGMAFSGPGANDYVNTPYVAADEELRRIVIGEVAKVDNNRCVIVDGVTMEIVAIYSAIGNVVAAGGGRALTWFDAGGSKYLKVYDVSRTGGTVASPLSATLLGTSDVLGTLPTQGMPAPASGLVMLGPELWRYSDSVSDDPPTLEEVVQRIAVRAGYELADVDASSLSGITVQGYVRRERMTGAAMLAPLSQAYGFDVAEVDGKLVARLRSATADDDIDWEDLIGGPGEPAVASRRAQESELPQQLDVSYFSYPAEYAVGSQSAQRIVTESRQKVSLDLPIVLPDSEAAAKCRRMIYEAWIGRNSRAFSLGPKWSKLVPADVVTLPLNDDGTATATVRLTSVARDGILIRCEAVDVDAAAFTQPDVAGDIPGAGGGSSAIAAAELALLPQLPPLRDDDDSHGLYAGVSSFSSGWPGAVLTLQSSDHADPFTVGSVNTRAVIGRATTALGDWDYGDARLDTTNTVEVAIECGELPASVTVDEILEGRVNAFAIGDEVVQAKTVTVVSGTTVRLSDLWRGLQGTFASGHSAGERVVGLDTSVLPIRFESSWVGNTGIVRATSFGQPSTRATVGSFTFSTDRVKPLPVANLRAVRLANKDIYIDWERRAKTKNIWKGGADTWLDEAIESYDIDIYNQAGTSVARALDDQSASYYTYSAANVATDQGLAKPTQLNIAVYQNGAVGRGRGEMQTITVLQPTSPLALLLHGDGSDGGSTFTDSSPYVHTVSRTTGAGAITTATAQKKFGSASIYFNAAQGGTYLSIPDDPILRLGLNDFTIDFWVYRTANGNVAFVISKRDRSGMNQGDFEIYADVVSDGKPCIRTYTNLSGNLYSYFSTALTLSAWNHVAFTRSGTTWRGFLNGTKVLEFTATYDINTPDPIYIGSTSDGSGANTTQYVDELRVLNGYCVWTSDFTPPGAPY